MASTSSKNWMPASGRYPVGIGTSLGRALKARKGGSAPKSKLPDRDFYSFRYNFKPESVDVTRPGTIEVRKGKDSTSVTVERASAQTGEGGHTFVGTETQAKEWECVLIYDEDLGTFSLEKLDSHVILTYDRKTPHPPRHAGSPHPSTVSRPSAAASSVNHVPHPMAQPSNKAQSAQAADALEAELERDLLLEEDAEGEPDDDFADILPIAAAPLSAPPPKKDAAKGKSTAKAKPQASSLSNTGRSTVKSKATVRKEEEEESEGEPLAIHHASPKAKAKFTATRPSQAKPAAASKAGGKASANHPPPARARPPPPEAPPTSAPPPAPPAVKNGSKLTTGAKRERAPQAEEEETLHFGERPVAQPRAKRARPSPPPAPKPKEEGFSLALPSGPGLALPSSSMAPPPAPLSLPGSSKLAVSLPSAPAEPVPVSDSEESWDDALQADADTGQPSLSIEMEEIVPTTSRREEPAAESSEEEIDMNAFEEEMNQHLGDPGDDDEDFLAAAVSPVAETQRGLPGARPMSLNEFAGGEGDNIWGDDDDYSSSEDSDDD